jgi:hypothetical protein
MPLVLLGGECCLETLNSIVECGLRFCRHSENDVMSQAVSITIENLNSTTSDS